jgi:hypothetical protein
MHIATGVATIELEVQLGKNPSIVHRPSTDVSDSRTRASWGSIGACRAGTT